MIGSLRQLLFHHELRIDEPDEADIGPLLDLLQPQQNLAAEDLHDLVAEVAAWSWEIGRETEQVGKSAPPFLRRAVDGLRLALRHHEVRVEDLSGRDFDIHENWERVVSAPREKRRPYIARMMVPRVFFRGELLRAGVPVVEDREETS